MISEMAGAGEAEASILRRGLALPVPEHWSPRREGRPLGLGRLRARQRRRDGLQAVPVEELRVLLVQEHGGAGQALAAGVPGTALLPFCSARLTVRCQHSGTQDTHEEPQGDVWFHLSCGCGGGSSRGRRRTLCSPNQAKNHSSIFCPTEIAEMKGAFEANAMYAREIEGRGGAATDRLSTRVCARQRSTPDDRRQSGARRLRK